MSKIKLMTYNVGEWYNGKISCIPNDRYDYFLKLQKDIINSENPDVLCCQEHVKNMALNKDTISNLLSKIFVYNYEQQAEQPYTGKCVSSNLEIKEIMNKNYDLSSRNFTKFYITIDGKKVCIINTHLSLKVEEVKTEFEELLSIIKDEEYFVICGDFNIGCHSVNDKNYELAYKQFLDRGYHLALNESTGFIDTFFSTHNPPASFDQIITSSNIDIEDVHVNKLKFEEQVLDGIDHIPLIANLIIK